MDKQEKQLGSLEEESLKRKERLKNLKRKKDEEGNENGNLKPKFRSYTPLDNTITENSIISKKSPDTDIDDVIQDHVELLTPITIDEIDLTSLAPRKQDWDLKRDIAKKLEKLEWRTQKAIGELIRERLNSQDNILQAVNLGTEFKTKD